MKKVTLSITEEYVSHWSWWEGARELMQNAVDTGDYHIDFGDGTLTITSSGGAIPVNALLMGKTTKKDDSSTIGKFGEGMKLGFLVLLREGAKVSVENGQDLWIPQMEEDDTFGCPVLTVHISQGILSHKSPNTVVVRVQGIPNYAMEEIEDNYAPTTLREVYIENNQGKAYKKIEDEDGEVSTDCALFVNGLFVCNVNGNFKFDYDFKPDVFDLDRDRGTVDTFDVKYHANQLLSECDDIELLARLAVEDYDDLALFSGRKVKGSGGSYWDKRGPSEQDILTDKAVELFKKNHGSDAFPISQDWSDGRKRLVTQMVISQNMVPITVKKAVYNMIEKRYGVDDKVENILVFKPLPWLKKFLDKYGRRLDSKPRKEIEKTIHMLKVAAGEE